MEVKGTVVLITGASSGIGAATALAFDRAGARIAVAARRADRLEKLVERMADALAVPTDLTDPAAAKAMVDATVDHFGRIDVLINNAATVTAAPGDRTRPDDVRRAIETNFIGPMVATNRAVRHMRPKGGGHIINVSSPAAVLGSPFLGAYSATKAALSGWTRSLQAEWEGTGVTVSEYFPGNVATGAQAESELGPFTGDVFDDPSQHPLLRALARPCGPEKIAADLVALVRRPRPVMYSSVRVRLGLWLAISSQVRRSLGAKMAGTVRRRLGLSVFSNGTGRSEAKAMRTPTTASKRKTGARKRKPARTAAGSPPTTRGRRRVARKTAVPKARRRKSDEARKDDRRA